MKELEKYSDDELLAILDANFRRNYALEDMNTVGIRKLNMLV